MNEDYLDNVVECECCHERFCTIHDMHWFECSCPGPHEEDDDLLPDDDGDDE